MFKSHIIFSDNFYLPEIINVRNVSPGDNIRKLKGIASKWVRHHNSILTTSQPEDNCEAANTRAERSCQGARCYCWKENFLSSASGCRNAIQKIKDKQLCRGEWCPYLSNVHTTNVVWTIVLIHLQNKNQMTVVLKFFLPVCDVPEDIYHCV